MSLEIRTAPIWNYTSSSGWYFPTTNTAIRSLAEKVKDTTGLPISYCYNSTMNASAQYGFAINFEGDIPPIASSDATNGIPAAVYVGRRNSSSGTPMCITICSGGTISSASWYIYESSIAASVSASSPSLRPNLAYVNHGGKTLIGVATDSMSAGGNLVFGAIIDHTRRRIVGFENTISSSTVDNIATVQQSKKFDINQIDTEDYDPPTYKKSSFAIVPPICSYNVVSMAPMVATEEAAIVEDVFAPVYLRDDQDSQQFDISNSEYVSRYITSGCKTQGGSQFVVRFESASNA